MTGVEHYREAERLLGLVAAGMREDRQNTVLAAAAVHAQLAQVAATLASTATVNAVSAVAWTEWCQATGLIRRGRGVGE